MTAQAQTVIHKKLAAKGYVCRRLAAKALGISLPTLARLVTRSRLKSLRYGSSSYVLWAKLRAASGAADLIDAPKSAAELI